MSYSNRLPLPISSYPNIGPGYGDQSGDIPIPLPMMHPRFPYNRGNYRNPRGFVPVPRYPSRSRRGCRFPPRGQASFTSHGQSWSQPENSEDVETQRDALIAQLRNGQYECMICCETVCCEDSVWNCQSCFNIFHLRCIRKWANSSTKVDNRQHNTDDTWRCPTCQNNNSTIPKDYRCFCGKLRDPPWNRFHTPHSCGDVCSKRKDEQCQHPCTLMCHPGPCPSCNVLVSKSCLCGSSNQSVRCNQVTVITCDKSCDRLLNCEIHQCSNGCHMPPCEECSVTVKQVCWCNKEDRQALCGSSDAKQSGFACGQVCKKTLSCGKHQCTDTCHDGPCNSCYRSPDLISTCPCGKQSLDALNAPTRQSCLEPLITCGAVCDKELPCGPSDNKHRCTKDCHDGPCGPCDLTMNFKCRCGSLIEKMRCIRFMEYNESNPFKCGKRCGKKKLCGRHKCLETCCTLQEHSCDQICGKKLACGQHKCELACHRGACDRCWNVSFDELRCHCGAEVILPPVACGATRPKCYQTCARDHSCSHPITHTCHDDEQCPPCVVLTKKQCMCGGQIRCNIPCHLEDVSCGLECCRPLPCGAHKCQRQCHRPPCVLEEGKPCNRTCRKPRPDCGHPCLAPCHKGTECPVDVECKAEVVIPCACGTVSERQTCSSARTGAGGRLATAAIQSQLALGVKSVDLNAQKDNPLMPFYAECTAKCAIIKRNRSMAEALGIADPELDTKILPNYPEYLLDFARQNTEFASSCEKTLSSLVSLSKVSSQLSRSHSFPSMKNMKRKFIHELAPHYGCESQSYDAEPNKNVVVTASREKSFVPTVSLAEMVNRQQGRVQPPGPVLLVEDAKPRSFTPMGSRGSSDSLGWLGQHKSSKKNLLRHPEPTAEVDADSVTHLESAVSGNVTFQLGLSNKFAALNTGNQAVSVSGPLSSQKSADSKTKGSEIDYFDATGWD